MIRLSGGGEAISGGQSGDLYIKIYVKKHPIFRKEDVNLVMDLPVKLTDALLGSEVSIKTLDGEILLKVPEGLKHGEILKIKGKGVPYEKGYRGDIMIKTSVVMPAKLSKSAKKAIQDLKNEGI
jgi:molecular chaperone DnaJ